MTACDVSTAPVRLTLRTPALPSLQACVTEHSAPSLSPDNAVSAPPPLAVLATVHRRRSAPDQRLIHPARRLASSSHAPWRTTHAHVAQGFHSIVFAASSLIPIHLLPAL